MGGRIEGGKEGGREGGRKGGREGGREERGREGKQLCVLAMSNLSTRYAALARQFLIVMRRCDGSEKSRCISPLW